MSEKVEPEAVPGRLCERSPDVRAAVLLDAAGGVVAVAGSDAAKEDEGLPDLVRELIEAVDLAAEEPPEQIEVRVERGTVYASRTSRFILAAVARRSALSSLMLLDMRLLLAGAEG